MREPPAHRGQTLASTSGYFSQIAASSGRSQVCLNACSQRTTPSYEVLGKPCCSPACKRFHLLRAAGTPQGQPSPRPPRRTKLSNHNLSQQAATASVNPAATSEHRATADRERAQPSISSPTSPFLPQALQAMAHAKDAMFSACFNKQEERQKGQRKSQSRSQETSNTQGSAFRRPGVRKRAPIYLPFEDEQLSALGWWPRLSSPSLSLTQAVALCAVAGFSQDSPIGGFLENKTLNPGFSVYGIFFTVKFIARNATRPTEILKEK